LSLRRSSGFEGSKPSDSGNLRVGRPNR